MSVSHWLTSLPDPLAKSIVCCRQESFSVDVNSLQGLNLPLLSRLSIAIRVSALVCRHRCLSKRLAIDQFYAPDFELFGYESVCLIRCPWFNTGIS